MSSWQEFNAALAAEFLTPLDVTAATRVGVRLILAALLGGAIGLERQSMGKCAGLRTHMLVALGSALVVLTPLESGADADAISRVLQGLLAGVGFLGAGAIIKGHANLEIHGITTAATVWMTAALGMTVAMGRDIMAVFATLLALIILRLLPSGAPTPGPGPPPEDP